LPVAGETCAGDGASGAIRWSTDGGASWDEVETGQPMFGSFVEPNGTLWGVGNNSAVWRSTTSGETWEQLSCNVNGNIDDMWVVNDTTVFLAGQIGLWQSDFNAKPRQVQISPAETEFALCFGDTLEVSVTPNLERYRWSDGNSNTTRRFTQAGRYVVTAYDARTCTSSSDTMTIRYRSNQQLRLRASDSVVCFGDTITISALGAYVSFLWSNGETTPAINVATSGTYSLTAVDTAGCIRKDSVSVIVREKINTELTSSRPLVICRGEQVELRAPSGYRQYRWTTGERTETITVSESE
jgi:hypothetical protein